jgi:hypothetical protein
MTTDSLADRILQALAGEAAPTRADADTLADALRAVLTKGTPQQVTDLLSRLVQTGVIIVQGDVNVARDDALLITRSNVQLAPGQDVILEALQTFRRRVAEDQALQTQLRVAEYLAAMRDYCASLPYLSLHDIRPPRTLDEVYVPLKVRPQPRKDAKDPQGLRPTEGWHDLEGLRQRHEPLSIADVMRQRAPPHVLILGEPGAGKSTLLRQLAERAWDAPDKIGLDAPCLPLLIPLRRLAELDGSLEERLNRALTGELALTQDLPQGFFTCCTLLRRRSQRRAVRVYSPGRGVDSGIWIRQYNSA